MSCLAKFFVESACNAAALSTLDQGQLQDKGLKPKQAQPKEATTRF